MFIPDVYRACLTPEGQSIYESLSPLRRRRAERMMIAALHVTGLNIEEVERLENDSNARLADSVVHIITRNII